MSTLPVVCCVQSLSTTVLLGELLDCGAHSTAELVACLRTKDAHELDFWGFVTTMTVSGKITNLLPVIDGEFVPRHPAESFKMGEGTYHFVLLLIFP